MLKNVSSSDEVTRGLITISMVNDFSMVINVFGASRIEMEKNLEINNGRWKDCWIVILRKILFYFIP